MRFGVAGLGSMGSRRVRDLLAAGHEVTGLDIRPDRADAARARFGIQTTASPEELLAGIEALVVSTPPDAHIEWYTRALETRLPFFSEANVLCPHSRWFGGAGYPSATWRFHPIVRALHERLASAEVYSGQHRYGGNLAAWHPWERYDEFYAGRRRETSAARELVPFELDILTWALGPVRSVAAQRDKRGRWATDIDDSYMLLLEFASGVPASLTVELHHAEPTRGTLVSCSEFVIATDMLVPSLRLRGGGDEEVVPEAFDLEQVYADEIAAFVAALSGGPYPKTWDDERHLSDVLYAAELSQVRREWVDVSEAGAAYDGLTLNVPARS